MGVFARVVVGVDGTDWGFEALRQALLLAPEATSTVSAVTALDTAPAVHTGIHAAHFAELLEEEAAEACASAERIIDGRTGAAARVVRGKPAAVLRRERDELSATLVALGGRRSSRFLGIMLGDTGTELLHDAKCSVLLVLPADEGTWQPREIVVGLDSSSHAQAALQTADELAERLGGSIEVVSATGGKPIERGAAWASRVQSWDPSHPVHALVDRSRDADLVVVAHEAYTASARSAVSANELHTRRTARRSSFTNRRLVSDAAHAAAARPSDGEAQVGDPGRGPSGSRSYLFLMRTANPRMR
jgi:nucleotide-binding universal stress UspA family protein